MVSVDRIYATSLMDIAYEENLQDIILNEVLTVKEAINQNEEIVKLIHSPILSKKQKIDIIDKIFKEKVNKYTLNFLRIISKNNRFNDVIAIIDEVKDEYNDRNNICEVEVETAVELSSEQKDKIVLKLQKSLGKTINIKSKITPEILGGIIIKLKNKEIDASVKKSLDNIFETISMNMV